LDPVDRPYNPGARLRPERLAVGLAPHHPFTEVLEPIFASGAQDMPHLAVGVEEHRHASPPPLLSGSYGVEDASNGGRGGGIVDPPERPEVGRLFASYDKAHGDLLAMLRR
jgi:hypothetical protein